MGNCSTFGALWQWTAAGGLMAMNGGSATNECLFMENRLALAKCSSGAPYNTLEHWASGQLAMNFTGSGAQGDYTGYPQCVDAFASTHAELWAASLANGDVLLLGLNPSLVDAVDVVTNMTAIASALDRQPIFGAKALRDVGARENVTLPTGDVFNITGVPSHGARLLRFTPT